MAFKSLESVQQAKFNSANSSEFLSLYEAALDDDIRGAESSAPSKTFAPSQIRCRRISWFRLRGVLPEKEDIVDRTLNFTAQVGTACHQRIQDVLSKKLDANWIDPEEYLNKFNFPYKYECHKNGFETQIEIFEPVPIKFAPDGIIFWKGKYWLLEIKTSEYSSFDDLSAPKQQHVDQIRCYAALLNLHNVLVIYQDRIYGNLKCYELTITDPDMDQVRSMFREVQECVKKNIAPPKLPKGDNWCSPSRCRYYNKCKEW